MAESEANTTSTDRKEKFSESMPDELLVKQIISWEKESEDYYSQLKRVWLDNIDYYKGIQTEVDRLHGRQSKAVENRVWMAVETMIPIATSKLPDIIVKPGQDDEQSQIDAQDHQDVLAYQMDRVCIQEKAERWMRDMILKRYGVFKVKWNKGIDDVDVEVVDPRRIRIPKHGKSVYALKFTIEDLELSYDSVAKFFGQAKANKLIESFTDKETESKRRTNNFIIQEVWTNETVVWRSGSYILDKKKNPYYDFENTDRNFLLEPCKPYIIKSLFETEESLIGETDYVQQVKRIQDNINNRKRQIENITGKTSNPILLIDSDVMSEEQASNISNEEGLILYGKDIAKGDKFRYEAPGQVPEGVFRDLEFSRSEFDNIWGVHSTTRGEREGRETLGGRQLLREADLGRIDLVARQLERALDGIAEYWTQLMKLFYTEERAFSILGEDGARFVKNFSGAKVSPVKPLIKPGSTLKEDEYAIQQKAILLWQNKAIGLKTLYKMIKLPDIAGALQDFQATYGQQQEGGGVEPPVPGLGV